MLKRIKKFFKRKPLHDKQLYCTSNGYAFVKCKRCGSESIPWQVSLDKAKQFQIDRPEMYQELASIDKNRVIGSCRD
jgi:hypothetical protein